MSEQEIKIYLAIDHRAEMVTISTTITAEDVCIVLCKRLGVGTVARHLFGLRIHGKPIFLKTGAKFDQKYRDFDFRVRYKPTDISKLYKLDAKAYDYLFHQTRLDVLDNKIPELLQEKYRKELVGLGITDMYRAMLEKNIPLEVIETDYKKYMPKEVLKRHMFFVKRPIHDTLVGMRRGNYDVRFVKSEYLKQVNKLAPEYLVEEYKTVLEDNGTESLVIVKLSQFAPEPGINYLYQDKKDKWHNVCSLEDLAFITIRDDLRVEISRKNGVPCYLRFGNQPEMMSFVSFVDGYYRLAVKWTFNVCKDVITPSLQKLSIMRCHGPVGGEFSYAKLEEVRGNKAGCFIVRESETQYNIYYIDVCTKNSSTPKTFKLELLSNNEFIFDNDLTKYKTIGQLIQAYGNEDNDVYLKELLPPSEYDKSPLLMCHKPTAGHALADMSDMVATMPVCIINHKDLQVYKAQKKVGSDGMTFVYRSMWKFAKTKKTEVAMKVLRPEFKDKHLKEFLESAAEWACLESRYFVKLVGVTLTSQISMVMEYFKLGPLDQYLRENAKKTTPADLMETATSLSFALWYLEEHGIVHGKIRCRKLLVCHHSDRELKVKLSDPGIRNDYDKSEIHWIPVEYYGKLEHARHSSAADVWAYGTTLWEIFSYGQKIRDMDHFEARKIYVGGKRLPKPPRCPDSIYDLMLECWHKDQHNRKKPQAIVRDISQLMYQVYHSRREHLYAKVFSSRSKRFARTDSCESLLSNITASTAPIHEISGEVRSIDEECELVLPTADGEGHEMIGGDGFDSTSDDFSMEFRNLNLSTEFSGIDSSFSSMQSIFELDDYNVILQGRIGEGYYGEVYRGTLEQLGNENELKEVAVKKLKKSAVSSTRQDFEREIEIMKALKHRNIVEIMGVQHEPEVLLVMEYIYHGSLQCYVKIHKDHLTIKQLMKYSLDIACGMQYLVRKNIVHRDLAARNILVVDEGHVKISDFGLARFMESDSDYYVLQTNRELPVKWYAPESIEEGKFSPRSDVWSYGVTLWEMFTYGEEPKFGVENKTKEPEQQHMLKLLQQGVRYPCLPQIPNAIFVRIIYPCWEFNQHNRPTFSTLCDVLENDLRNDIV